jgi:hypothetical protein
MSEPLIVSIPHHLGKDEAMRRLKSGLTAARAKFGSVLTVVDERWTDDRLQFNVSALGQSASGTIDVAEDHVVMEVALPWLIGQFATKLLPLIREQGTLLLDKKQI